MFKGNNYFIAEIRDKEFVDEVISVLLNSSDRDITDEVKHILRRMIETDFIDIAIPTTDLDGLMQREILYYTITSILQNKPISVIREELLSNATLNERVEYILNTYKVNKKIHAYIEPLKNKMKLLSVYKFLIKLNNRITGLASDIKENLNFEDSVSDIVENINNLYKEINFDKIQMEVSIADMSYDDIKSFLNTYVDASKNFNVIRSGIRTIDSLFNLGGFYKGNIYMFSAPYGTGKTRFLTILGGNIFLQGYNVLHITIENEKEEVLRLYNSFIMQMDDSEIIELIKSNGIDFVANEIRNRFSVVKQKYNNDIKLRKLPYKSNPKDIENILISEDAFKPDVILLDHVDLLYSNGGKNDSDLFKRMEDVMSELKDICERYRVCMIIASQLNREGSKGRKDLSFVIGDTVSRSIAKNELTSFHAILMQTFEESINNYIRIFIDKNRFGIQNVMFPLYFDKGRLYVEEILTDEDFEKYVSCFSGLTQNKNTQRVINAMKMFINSINSKINNDLYNYKNNISKSLKSISEILNYSDEVEESNTTNTVNNYIEENNHNENSDINIHEDILNDEINELVEDELKIVYNNKEYSYKEFMKTFENNNENKDDVYDGNIVANEKKSNSYVNNSFLLNKTITNLSKLIDEGFFDEIINENNINNNISEKIELNKNNIKEDKLNKIQKNMNNNIDITVEKYINNYIKHTDFNKLSKNYETEKIDGKTFIKLNKDTYYNVIEINKDVINNLEKEIEKYYEYTKIDRKKIDMYELFLVFMLLNGINHNNIPSGSFGNIFTVIKNIEEDETFLKIKGFYTNDDNIVYEIYRNTIICDDSLITKEDVPVIDRIISENCFDMVFIEKGSMLIATNTDSIYIIAEDIREYVGDAIIKFYEKYKDMSLNEFYKHYKTNLKLIDAVREAVGEYSLVSPNDKIVSTFLHSVVSLVYSQ